MCYNIAYIEKRSKRIEEHYGASFKPDDQPLLFYHASGFTHPQVYVITQEEPQFIQPYGWGLIPGWCKDENKAVELRKHTLNAVAETVFEKPAFRSSVLRRRCLVIVSGFFEWHTLGKKKFPFYIHHATRSFFSMGGIYDHWLNRETGEIHKTFAIVTTAANHLLSKIHNSKQRMPLVFTEEKEKKWIENNLTRADIEDLLKPLPDGELKAYSISKRITDRSMDSNVPEVMEPVEYAELGSL